MRRSKAHFVCLVFLMVIAAMIAAAQQPQQGKTPMAVPSAAPSVQENAAEGISPESQVWVDGRAIFHVPGSLGGYSAEERAKAIQTRVVDLFRDRRIPINSVRAEDRGGWSEIVSGRGMLMRISESDAQALGRVRQQVASEYAEIIRATGTNYREQHTWKNLGRGSLYAILSTFLLLLVLRVSNRIRNFGRTKVHDLITSAEAKARGPAKPSVFMVFLLRPLFGWFTILYWLFVLVLVETYITVVLSFFAATAEYSKSIAAWSLSQISTLGINFVEYLPKMLVVVVICLVTYYILRANTVLFGEIETKRITIRGFYPDWAEPTRNLVKLLILILAGVIVFPYLPGSESPAFRGISVFVGLLLSLGSTSAVANAVAGTILTYMRSFQVGDWVRIGDVTGEVVEKSFLVTRVLTPKNEIVTLPNGAVMSASVMNYSAVADSTGVIFHTTVTIGYDAPWRKVHELLISAALATDDIVDNPKPFVLQTALNDFFVSYQLNAFTHRPNRMPAIYSKLHQSIQDKFNEGGVEIMSPHYYQLRDGNTTTVPENYRGDDYIAKAFQVEQREQKSEMKKAGA